MPDNQRVMQVIENDLTDFGCRPSVLFSHSYFYRFDAKQWKNQQPYPPLGTLVAAAVLREAGFEVSLFDTALRADISGLKLYLEAQPDFFVVYDDGFNYLTKMCLTTMREAAFEMLETAKKAGCRTVVCSSDSTDHFEKYLARGADFVILGEGELALRELLGQLHFGLETRETLGIAFKNEAGKAVKNAPRAVATDLDALPDAAWDLVKMADYQAIWHRKSGFFSLNMATTRGCPYKCNWCAKPIYGNRYNSRNPERVAEELFFLVKNFGVAHFWMADDIFGLKPNWPQRFRDEVKKRDLKIKFKIQSRADLLLKTDTIAALAESGCDEIWIGAESGSQHILDSMDKGTTVEQIEEATKMLRKHGIRVCFFLQFGYLGETWGDIEKTLEMLERLRPDDIGASISYPLPGTKFFEMVKSQLGEKQNWTDSDDLAMMYKGTFSPAFYKQLHRLVHKKFRKKQGLEAVSSLFSGKKVFFSRIMKIPFYAAGEQLDLFRLKKLRVAC